MPVLNLKPTHKAINDYYIELGNVSRQLDIMHEGAVSLAFAILLQQCARQKKLDLIREYSLPVGTKRIRLDGAILDEFKLLRGIWEAKDSSDDLAKEVKAKFEKGYPQRNILFQAPERMIIWQDGRQVFDKDITQPEALIEGLNLFFGHESAEIRTWGQAVEGFKDEIPHIAQSILHLIDEELEPGRNKRFVEEYQSFRGLCRETINPNLADPAIKEMLIQHILTVRLFRKVFHNDAFTERNAVAARMEKVITALISRKFSREDFLKPLDRFYVAIERTAETIEGYSEKQHFLNVVYEKFFQGFSVKLADTHGIVYTPQPVVDFMVRSVEEILKREFGRSLSDEGVHILDPFVGTGNFIIRVMREIQRSRLPFKYANELHCNEVMLLPYYVASMNIEHAYYEAIGEYRPFEGICLTDTFELAEKHELELKLFTEENTERVDAQKRAPIFVIISNPPYNAHQVNENDNNKNRKYPMIDKRVAETYSKDSTATNKNALSDVYVKALRWASDRIGEEGVIAFITNNSFIDEISFNGLRMNLESDFDSIHVLNLNGNVRKNPKISGTSHNVFGIQVGVSISLLVKNKKTKQRGIYYHGIDEFWRKEEKFRFLDGHEHIFNVDSQKISPDNKHTWLTEGMHAEFETFVPMGSKEGKAGSTRGTLLSIYSRGAETTRDNWVYNFSQTKLMATIGRFIDQYNFERSKWHNGMNNKDIDSFLTPDERKIKWCSTLKQTLSRDVKITPSNKFLRFAQYRPFCKQHLYFDPLLIHRPGRTPIFLPTPSSEVENRVLVVNSVGTEKPFTPFMSQYITDQAFLGGGTASQCFPFYTYAEDGTHRRENITDWALEQFRAHYHDPAITKWDIFHYVYGLLHHPEYRTKYAANLRRELPRIPQAPDFRGFAEAGKRLAELHVEYESQREYPLRHIENPKSALDWRVEKMRLSKDKTTLVYNDFLTLTDIPPEVYEYKLGNRSALEWIVDQYRVKTDPRSGITNDPNRPDEPEYIVRLLKKIVTVSLETVKVVKGLPGLG